MPPKTLTKLSRRTLQRDAWGCFVGSSTARTPLATSPQTENPSSDSDYAFPSEPHSPAQTPASPEFSSIRGLSPSRAAFPSSPDPDDYYMPPQYPFTPLISSHGISGTRRRAATTQAIVTVAAPLPTLPAPALPPVPAVPLVLPPVPAAPPVLPPVPVVPPVLPPVPVAPPAQQARGRLMAEVVPLFYGDGSPLENPRDFLKAFNQTMRYTNPMATEEEKITALADYLGSDSPAETWYQSLNAGQRSVWADFTAAFYGRWP